MIKNKLNRVKRKTKWSWERMCRELHRVMGEEGPSHTTLFRYANGNVKRHNALTARYIDQGLDRLIEERN